MDAEALSQRDRGTPLTAGVRRTLGLTKGRPGVKSTICRAPTAEHGVHAGLDEEGEMRVGTQAPIRHEHITGGSHRVHLVHLGEIVGEEGRDDQLQEHTGARMEQPQEARHGKAASRPLPRRLAERVLEGRRIGHRAPRAIDEKGAMALPPPVVQGGSLHGAPKRSRRRAKRRNGSFARA